MLTTGEHSQCRRWLAIEATITLSFHEAIINGRDVAQFQPCTVGVSTQHKFGELTAGVDLSLGAQQYVAARRVDGSARHVDR